jgi:ATP-binding cassette subfamily B protein
MEGLIRFHIHYKGFNLRGVIMEYGYIWKAIKLIWSNSKGWVFITLILTIILGFLPITTIILNKELINSVASFIMDSTKNKLQDVLLFLSLQFALVIINSLLQSLKTYCDRKNEIKIGFILRKTLLYKLDQYSMEYFEHPNIYEHYMRIKGNQANNFLFPITSLFSIIQGLISFMSFIVFLIKIHWSLAILSIVAALPIFK